MHLGLNLKETLHLPVHLNLFLRQPWLFLSTQSCKKTLYGQTPSRSSQEAQKGGKASTNLTFRFPMSCLLGVQHGEFLLIF